MTNQYPHNRYNYPEPVQRRLEVADYHRFKALRLRQDPPEVSAATSLCLLFYSFLYPFRWYHIGVWGLILNPRPSDLLGPFLIFSLQEESLGGPTAPTRQVSEPSVHSPLVMPPVTRDESLASLILTRKNHVLPPHRNNARQHSIAETPTEPSQNSATNNNSGRPRSMAVEQPEATQCPDPGLETHVTVTSPSQSLVQSKGPVEDGTSPSAEIVPHGKAETPDGIISDSPQSSSSPLPSILVSSLIDENPCQQSQDPSATKDLPLESSQKAGPLPYSDR